MIKIGRIVVGMVQTNCYFVYRSDAEGKKKAIVFDPGDQGKYLATQISNAGFEVVAICLTHGHFDHILGVKQMIEETGAKLYAYEQEKALLNSAHLNCSDQVGKVCTLDADAYLKDQEKITLADIELKLIATPGHTAGSCCYYIEEAGFLISGDTLFHESVGRTDLPTGSSSKLIRSIQDNLFCLPDATVCYPGHGDSTTIGFEKENNPFCC